MHELGPNLGLTHGGGTGAASNVRYKPNRFSVMGYSYNFGIGTTATPGPFPTATVDPSTSYRIDYSGRTLPTLNEQDLDETVGVQGPPSNQDVTVFYTNFGTCRTFGPSNGTPIDWDATPPTSPDGNCLPYTSPAPYMAMHVVADVAGVGFGVFPPLTAFHDWPNLFYCFQCTFLGRANGAPLTPLTAQPELTFEEASRRHLIYPQRKVNIAIRPGCSEASKPVAPGQPGAIAVTLLGEDDLDVTEVERSSLRFGGEPPVQISVADVNHDGRPDLLLVFDMAKVRLQPNDKLGWLSGWLRDSQELVGSDSITIVPNMAFVNASCR